ncbi:MAG: T9SS type A sorting domain-containing protein [Bacteroidetes bacterium]|nr:T9SS type A sorting domain-containing protein [Bacteroidota bacterium]
MPAVWAQEGQLDPAFGTDGKVFDLLQGSASDVAVQSDGGIVVAGWAFGPDGVNVNVVVTQLRADGTLDTSFGTDGVTQTDISGGDEARRLVRLPDDHLLVAGLTERSNPPPSPQTRPLIAVARYTPEGTLDPTFGTGGYVIADLADRLGDGIAHDVSDLVVAPDGRFYVAGSVYGNQELGNDHPPSFLITRFLPDGTLDPSFGENGSVITDVAAEAGVVLYLALQPDGVVAAAGFERDEQRHLALLRYDLDGTLDEGFGTGSAGTVPLNSLTFLPVGLSLLPNGILVVAGDAETATEQGVAVARFDAGGRLDDAFANGGLAFVPLTSRMLDAGTITAVYAADALFDSDGSVLIGGSLEVGSFDYFLAQFDSGGNLDEAFGTEGLVTTDFDNGFDDLYGLARQPDGQVVAVGHEFKIARYVTDDPTASEDGPSAARAIQLEPPFPNPARETTNVGFTLTRASEVRLVLYDLLGREVALLADGGRAAGTYTETLDARELPAGLYLLRLEAEGGARTQPVLLTR